VLDDAVALSVAVGARISAIACEAKIPVPGSPLGRTLLNVPAMVAAELKKSAINAQDLLAAFQDVAERNGVFQDRILEHCFTSEVPHVLVDYARLRDLTIVPVPEGDHVQQWYAESIIFGSGRPALILPQTRPRAGIALNTIIVAWDFSRPAARAVAGALPLLEKAKRVLVITVVNEKTFDTKRSGPELAKHLSRHGVSVALDAIDAAGRTIGDAINSQVESRNADLLVMGAYGHSRFREFFLVGLQRACSHGHRCQYLCRTKLEIAARQLLWLFLHANWRCPAKSGARIRVFSIFADY
jgi:nucleotide-binding universal stress UspA family protein